MPDKATHQIFLIESNAGIQERIGELISQIAGYSLSVFDTAAAALGTIEDSSTKDISLIISSYRMPKMKGDEVLRKARALSPDSQRILISDISDINTMINAVNTAEIHSCLVLPFKDEEFVDMVKRACEQFSAVKQQKNLAHVTRRQNKQLFRMASDLKKVDEKQVQDIEKRKAVIKKLANTLSRQAKENQSQTGSIETYLATEQVQMDETSFGRCFSRLIDQVTNVFSDLVNDSESPKLEPLTYDGIASSKEEAQGSPEFEDKVKKMIPFLLNALPGEDKTGGPGTVLQAEEEEGYDEYLELAMTENRVKAFIKVKKYDSEVLTIDYTKEFLALNHVISGLKPDEEIEAFLKQAKDNPGPFTIAEGKGPKLPQNAQIRYYFPKDYKQAGKLLEDGTIDFTDRGKIPFVKSGTCLAAKIHPISGEPGTTVTGDEVPVSEPEDLAFEAGEGAKMTEDGVQIYADADGQPHLDALGTVSVLNELVIQKDIDFETGNIDFSGNLIVKGTVKPGFKVKAASLTCQQIEGADILLTGDLNCSAGIIDAKLIKVRGNIQAKYINNSIIDSFGDLVVQKEIIDSAIQISGSIINTSGSILSSKISAKGGIDAGNIGTDVSNPSELAVGVDTYLNRLLKDIDRRGQKLEEEKEKLKKEIQKLDKQNHDLQAAITENAHLQDRSQLEIKDIQGKMASLDPEDLAREEAQLSKSLQSLEKKVHQAQKVIEQGFEEQGSIDKKIAERKDQFKHLNSTTQRLEKEREVLSELDKKKKAVPEVKVKKAIRPGTRIQGPHSHIRLNQTETRCKILEIRRSGDDLAFYEMTIVSDV